MQKKNIFKALAFAMLMPAMLLTTACSSEDDLVNNEPTVKKGYAIPVTVNVTRQGDATTRATYTYNENTKKGTLAFSDGDKLFVRGDHHVVGKFAGTLTWQSGGTFSGTIYTESPYEDTADDLFAAASAGSSPECYLTATLLPNDYDANSFLSIDDQGTTNIAYDDRLTVSFSDAFVASETAKATGVEQLSLEQASTYSNGFALAPQCAILNFTISGLEAGAKDVTLNVTPPNGDDYTVTGSVTPTSGVATFAIGVPVGANIKDTENNLTVGTHNFTLPSSTTFAAGKIYNITRSAAPALTYPIALSAVTSDYIGSVVTTDGNVYPAKTAVPDGKTAVGILGKVTATGQGLILALKDAATQQTWSTINGWTSVTTYASTTLKLLTASARGSSLTSYTMLGSTTVSDWCVAQKSDYEAIFINLGSKTYDNGTTYDANVNAYITTGVGGTDISGVYWSATEEEYDGRYYGRIFISDRWEFGSKGTPRNLRPVLGF